jgi:hypothetical protein
MANRQFSRLSFRWRVMLILFAVIILPVELIVHRILAREYYYLNVKSLQLTALTAVKMGAEYLPADPRVAVQVADAYAQSQGIAPAEIVFIELSSNNHMLAIRLDRKFSRYMAVLAMGGLPARDISVTASAWRQGAAHPFGTKILDVLAAQSAPSAMLHAAWHRAAASRGTSQTSLAPDSSSRRSIRFVRRPRRLTGKTSWLEFLARVSSWLRPLTVI